MTACGFSALHRIRQGSNAMGVCKREHNLEELLSDPVVVTVLLNSRITPDHLQVLLRNARERLAKARAASETSHAPVASPH